MPATDGGQGSIGFQPVLSARFAPSEYLPEEYKQDAYATICEATSRDPPTLTV
jgi:hypothetical protein